MKIMTLEKNLTWVDIENPAEADIEYLKTNFNFHQFVLGELTVDLPSSKIEKFNDYVYIVLHIPTFDNVANTTIPHELDVLITKEALITVHHRPIQTLQEFAEQHATPSAVQKCTLDNSGKLLYDILKHTMVFYSRQILHINDKIADLENKIFNSKNGYATPITISVIKRDVLDFRRNLKPKEHIFTTLVNDMSEFFGNDAKLYFREILHDYKNVWDVLENYKATIESLENTNDSILSAKTNEVIRTLTVVSTILFTIGTTLAMFHTGIFIGIPIFTSGWHSFAASLFIITTVGAVLGIFCKKKQLF